MRVFELRKIVGTTSERIFICPSVVERPHRHKYAESDNQICCFGNDRVDYNPPGDSVKYEMKFLLLFFFIFSRIYLLHTLNFNFATMT